jgi:hypothetical protein
MGCLCSKGTESPNDSDTKPTLKTFPAPPPAPPPAPSPALEIEVVALHKFEARADDEILFEANDILIIKAKPESDWWEAVHKKTEKKSFIPSNYVDEPYTNPLSRYLWYHGDLNRNDTTQMMRSQGTGSYLLQINQLKEQ